MCIYHKIPPKKQKKNSTKGVHKHGTILLLTYFDNGFPEHICSSIEEINKYYQLFTPTITSLKIIVLLLSLIIDLLLLYDFFLILSRLFLYIMIIWSIIFFAIKIFYYIISCCFTLFIIKKYTFIYSIIVTPIWNFICLLIYCFIS